MIEREHIEPLLDDWLDARLEPDEHRAVERHLAACDACRQVAEGLRLTRQVLRESAGDPPPAADLEARVRATLDREDAASAAASAAPALPIEFPAPANAPSRPWRWAPLAAAALVALAVGGLLLRQAEPPNHVEDAFADYHAVAAEPADLAVAGASALAERWRRARLGFPVRVLEMSAMGIELVGGGVRSFGDQPAALALYRDAAGEHFACWMFEGLIADLPPPLEERERGGFRFKVYHRDGVTLVVWREGEVLCALAARGDVSRVVELAFAKAQVPAALGATL